MNASDAVEEILKEATQKANAKAHNRLGREDTTIYHPVRWTSIYDTPWRLDIPQTVADQFEEHEMVQLRGIATESVKEALVGNPSLVGELVVTFAREGENLFEMGT